MKRSQTNVTILMADDDHDDQILVREALAESQLPIDLYIVSNGEDLLDYLYNHGLYTDKSKAPRPGLILLDLNMPKKNGLEVLQDIKTDPILRSIPVIVLSTSEDKQEIYRTYDLGANSFITKPVKFAALVEIMKNIGKYWFGIVQLPLESVGEINEQRPHKSSVS
ncbi:MULTISPECIES: response regulator [Cyanophyceae]|uniref:response regulator n=1 Tax=Cyanophyceae TaxID=3028117 RepID=UPI00232B55F1|nr:MULTISPECIES: response regulator [Cyanophyceae]MDB9355129.1 response regulator [Nodularia spumigena CS-587/03]MDB9340508.1 response regulator [Nodularia spumigena CS-589/07]MDB9400005.1 response regulator [Microcystis aeruginosa CS-567/02-A1]MDB9499887.1 response regulator [Nodularia spumigena CS-336/02]MDB9531439.1 response regulator [Nodularia spumigena CS-1038]